MAALDVGPAPAHMNGTTTPINGAEEEDFFTQLLKLRDTVLAGKHPHYTLPLATIKQLDAALIVPDAPGSGSPLAVNGVSYGSHLATSNVHPAASRSFPPFGGLPGLAGAVLQNGNVAAHASKPAPPSALDPIFLEKSDSLVRAEAQLKRQRIERELLDQVDRRKHTSSAKETGVEAQSHLDVDAILLEAQLRVKPVSGLKISNAPSDTSFDENDYYSSQEQSDWSSPASSTRGSDRAADAFSADFERLEEPVCHAPVASASASKRSVSGKGKQSVLTRPRVSHASKGGQHFARPEPEGIVDVEDEDDDYTPPDAAAFDGFDGDGSATNLQQATPPEDNSDYEPGELTAESNVPTPQQHVQQRGHPSPQVPIIRNQLTHIAAPQPNRVSPLAMAKGPSIELELVNGRPEIVQKPQQRQPQVHSRASTGSPSGTGAGQNVKKHRRNKHKRKRDKEELANLGRGKRRRDRQAAQSPTSSALQEPFIKREPVSPPPFANVPETHQSYEQPIDVDDLHQGQPRLYSQSQQQPQQPQYVHVPSSGLRYEYTQPAQPSQQRMAPPAIHRPMPRDQQDLRRAASLHYAQRPASPTQRAYSPAAPYQARAASVAYGMPHPHMQELRYADEPAPASVRYVRQDREESPLRLQEYREPVEPRLASPALMPPPTAQPRRIVVDQYGNRYYAAEPDPRAVLPVARQPESLATYDRAPSRMSVAYALPPPLTARYEQAEMAPPPAVRRPIAQEQPIEYVDANGYRVRAYARDPEPTQYMEAPTPPVYQEAAQYQQMPPPPTAPAREPSTAVYAPASRAYSVRPEEAQPIAQNHYEGRQASVAPVQYVRQDMPPPAPIRAVSVLPGCEYGAPVPQRQYSYTPQQQTLRYADEQNLQQPSASVRAVSVVPGDYSQLVQQRAYSYAPQAVRYVDEYGREVQAR